MTKLVPIFIDGKKWVQLSQLTVDQAHSLKSFLPVNCFKKILFQGIELSECLDFAVYDFWYRSIQVSDQKQPLSDF
jgi:hypothetical protein